MSIEMRAAYQETLHDLLESNPKVVMLDADLASASGSTKTFEKYPQQCINVGISEANMMSSACGMALTGLRPFVHTFAPFATRRVFDQVFMSGAYSHNSIHIYGSDPGFWAQHNGGTHTSYEDIALMRTLPGIVVSAPCDRFQFDAILRTFINDDRLYYTRAPRKLLPDLYTESSEFTIGKWIQHGDGKDGVVVAIGVMVHEALKAQQTLKDQGINITVVDAWCIKPHDEIMLEMIAKTYKKIIVAENHSIYGGLGDLVSSEVIKFGLGNKVLKVAVNDQFGEVGTSDYLQAKHRLNAERIVETFQSM